MDYLNGREVTGKPKTVTVNMRFRNKTHSAPLEVWITSFVAVMTPEQKEVLFRVVDENLEVYKNQMTKEEKADIVADIIAPNLLG